MKQYLSLIVLGFTSVIVIYFYYIGYPFHSETKDIYFFAYLLVVSLLFGGYKILQSLSFKNGFEIKLSHIIYGFLIQFILICIFFFLISGEAAGAGVALFFKSIIYIIGASIVWLNFYCLGSKLLSLHRSMRIEDKNIHFLSSIATGCMVSFMLIFILLSIGFYNATGILLLMGVSVLVSYSQWMHVFRFFGSYSIHYKNKKDELFGNTALLIDEIVFVCITFLISVNFVSIFRPFPIGWDDLGAYMNYPKLLSAAGEHIALGKMYAWELYTGIGFLFGSQTFAFFLNSFMAIIAAIVVSVSVNMFTKNTSQKYNLGLLCSLIFLMMPMVVFQAAKDMKLDIGLFSISVIAISLLYYLIFTKKDGNYILYILVGLIIGFTFSIKVTSLLLVLGALAALFYARYKLLGFIGFLGMFIGVFSLLGVWKIMNVIVPSGGTGMQIFSLLSIIIGLGVFTVGVVFNKEKTIKFGMFVGQVGAIILGFVLVLLPWGIKHIGEIPEDYNTSITTFISGVSDHYRPDFINIYSLTEIEEIRLGTEKGLNESGTTTNEDFGRYLGYEKGINNFLKLPWNLSFQINQKGEFTDITFIFLAVLPTIFLFLPYRKQQYKYPLIGALALSAMYFIPSPVSGVLGWVFSNIALPDGYIYLIGVFLMPLIYLSWALDKTKRITQIFLVNLAFLTLYMGLWAVSAFGIVWYGIPMYFLMLLAIVLCIISVEGETRDHTYLSYIFLGLVAIYMLQSSIPHGIANLKNAGYKEYKLGLFSEEVSLMTYHPEYFSIVSELNISDEGRKGMLQKYRNNLLEILDDTQHFDVLAPQIQKVGDIRNLHQVILQFSAFDFGNQQINSSIGNIKQNLYDDIIYPDEGVKNTANIYRIGTFLKYFISENNKRLLEDSLLTQYRDYLHADDPDIISERFKKLGLSYLLIDLNAATIDRDPEKNLTRRYEDLLTFLVHPSVELIETDSICLRFALDRYKIDGNIENYKLIGGVNYNNIYASGQKKQTCLQEILKVISDEQGLVAYPYLQGYKNALENAGMALDDTDTSLNGLARLIPNGYKALFKLR